MIRTREDFTKDTIFEVADRMATAAITAPKASGQDKIIALVVSGEEKDRIAAKMRRLSEDFSEEFIGRDAGCLDACQCVVLIGVMGIPFGLDNCAMCGFENCAMMAKAGANCALNLTDLGIAIGSAVSIAADARLDNRVMYSIGRAVREMDLFPDDVRVCYGIPLSATSKSIFFDRGPGAVLR